MAFSDGVRCALRCGSGATRNSSQAFQTWYSGSSA